MQLLTFVGTGRYDLATYRWEDREPVTSEFVAEAAAVWLRPSRTLVALTESAERHANWTQVRERLEAHGCPVVPVSVPEGASEQDLWRLFDSVCGSVEPDQPLALDITHGFRSLPLLMLLAVAYLRVTRRVDVPHILYGAWEARTAAEGVPVLDLAPFVRLLDWTVAADRFVSTGYGQGLAELLDVDRRPELLGLQQSIVSISQGLHLIRPQQTMEGAASLPDAVGDPRLRIAPAEPAFAQVLGAVEEGYGSLALPVDQMGARPFVSRLLDLVEWYRDRGQFVQCVSVAREWLPTLVCAELGIDWFDPRDREKAELWLAGGKTTDTAGNVRESPYRDLWRGHRLGAMARRVWGGPSALASLRNDVLHAGFRRNPHPAAEAIERIVQIVGELRAIHELWVEGAVPPQEGVGDD